MEVTVDMLSGYKLHAHRQTWTSESTPETQHQPIRQHHTLVVMVLTRFSGQENRKAIRSTWKNSYVNSTKKFYLKFAIGTLQLNPAQKDLLLEEEATYNDILILPDLYDVYDNLTMKVLQSLIWIEENLNYSYVLKCDDDSFVRLDKMEAELMERSSRQGLYWGQFVGDHYPPHSGKWKDTRWFTCDYYLPHALGGGYVISAKVVHKIYLFSDMILTYQNEDASMGAWTSAFDIERKHDFRFQTRCDTGQQCACDNRFLIKTLHYDTVQTMYTIDKRLRSNQTACELEKKERHYCYNWNVLPSKCCLKTCVD